MLFENEVIFVGRHEHGGVRYHDRSDGSRHPWVTYGEKPTWLTLSEAAARAHVSVEEIKRAIRDGELPAERRGWVRIHRGDLMDWLHRI